MKIILISDDDIQVGHLPVKDVDLLVSLGDLYDQTILRAVKRYEPSHTLALRGNHDTPDPFPPPIRDLHLQTLSIDGITLGGFGGSWKYKPRGFHLFEQEEVAHLLRNFPPVDVFLAHNSPAGIHERDDHVHQGFEAFQEYIYRAQPRWFFHGHQHRDLVTQLGGTTIVGVYGEKLVEMDV